MDGVYIGIDLGTSGVRARAIDREGRVLGQADTPLPAPDSPCPGCREQAPAAWWRATLETLDRLPPGLMSRARALCVDGTSGTLLLCDREGEPTTPGLMYNDQRALAEAARLAGIAPAEAAVHGPNSALAKLMWLRGQGRRGRHALHQADWIAHRLGAPIGVSDVNNCLKLGYDPVRRRWPDWLAGTGINAALLPEVVPVGARIGRLDAELARRWGCAGPVDLVAGTTDSNAATLATGIDRPGDAVTALGSTLVLKILSERPVFAPEYGVYSHRLGERWLVGGASNSGGAVLRRFFDDRALAELSARIDPARDSGLDYYPLPAPGERFPLNDPRLAPRLAPRPDDPVRFLHGLLEGMAHIEQAGYARLRDLGAPRARRVLSTGGGAFNPQWRALRARILGVPVALAAHSEAAYGAALIAAGRMPW